MLPVVTAAEMRELDRVTIQELGLPGVVLMENAGRALAEEVRAATRPDARVAVVCGPGNNGGDGYVCARWLRAWDRRPTVYLAAARPKTGTDAHVHLAAYEKMGGPVADASTAEALAAHEDDLAAADVVVDALLGTGLRSEVKGHLATVIEAINGCAGVRIACDIPSGLDSDTGRVLGVAVKAHRTVTFALPKLGLVTHPGFEQVGALTVAEIGIPRALAASHGVKLSLFEESDARTFVGRRDRGGHKGTYGHLLVVAGSAGKPGAALLASTGALRSGAGLVTLASAPGARAGVEGRVPEIMCAELELERGAPAALAALRALTAGKQALACGPGMPTSAEAGAALRAAVPALDVPTVFDADALNHLAKDPAVLRTAKVPVVLTPHPGEAARLLGAKTADIQADRVAAARRLARETGCVVVLKGARTVVAAPDGDASINPTGNPGMGTAGTGDVLTGVIGALLAQGFDAYRAARVGAWAHGAAGDRAAEARGEMGLVAGDLLDSLPAIWKTLETA